MLPLAIASLALLTVPEPPKGRLIWSDEFNGNALDLSKWQAPAMNRQGDASRWDPARVRVQDGKLWLEAERQSGPGPRYACGAVRTRVDYDPGRTLFQARYGIFEIRAKLPTQVASDLWFAFWLMSGDIRDGQTDSRKGSEIDVIETFHAWQNRLGHAVHWGGYGPTHNAFDIASPTINDLNDGQFHTYTLRWSEREYAIYRDGKLLARTDALGLGNKADRRKSLGTSREPGYLKLTVEAAPWAGPKPDWETVQPARDVAVVDYIRVYALPL